MGEKVSEEHVEMLDRHRIVVLPPDRGLGVRIAHDELILRAASGMRASVGDEGPMRGDACFVPLQCVLVELRRAEIPVDRGQIAEAKAVRAKIDIMRPVLDHASSVSKKARRMDGAQIQAISCPTVNPTESGADPRSSSAPQPMCSRHVAMSGRGPGDIADLASLPRSASAPAIWQ